jgi:hypothetical protein
MNLDGLVEEVLSAGIEGALHGLHLLLDISKQIFKNNLFHIQEDTANTFTIISSLRKLFTDGGDQFLPVILFEKHRLNQYRTVVRN